MTRPSPDDSPVETGPRSSHRRDPAAGVESGDKPPPDARKAAFRAEARARLRAMPSEARAAGEKRIGERVWTVPEVEAARSILLFASLPTEVSTDRIAEEARRRRIQVVYPRCLPETTALSLHAVDSPELLLPGFRGIREPAVDCPLITLPEIDIVFVPGLAWDNRGHRLGRGAGYYDRLFALPVQQPFRIGLFFEDQRMDNLPTDPWDGKVDLIVTEAGIWRAEE